MASRFTGGKRMGKVWSSMPGTSDSLAASGTFLEGTLGFAEARTVIRMLGEYIIGPSAAPVAADVVRIAVGIGLVSTDAATLGASALPDPSSEPNFPWLFWAEHAFNFPGTDPQSGSDTYSVRRSFDIRSMRKVRPRETLVFVVQYVDVSGAPPMTIGVAATRVLLAFN